MPAEDVKSKKSYHHGDLREALLAAALDILEEGVDPKALTLREAARRAGVSAMAPYRHFADKDALLAGVALIGFKRLSAALARADSHPEANEALIAQGVAYVTFAIDNPALFRLMFGQTSVERTPEFLETSTVAYKILRDRVETVVAPQHVDEWTLTCWSTVHGLAMLGLDGGLARHQVSPPFLAARILRLLQAPDSPAQTPEIQAPKVQTP